MNETYRIGNYEVEVEARYRVEMDKWEARLCHPVHGFSVSEWAETPQAAARGAYRALLFYAREIERVISRSRRRGARASQPA